MNPAKKQDRKRLLVSFVYALGVHAVIFLAIGLSGLLQQDTEGEFFGPLNITISDYTSFPDPARVEGVPVEGPEIEELPVPDKPRDQEAPVPGERSLTNDQADSRNQTEPQESTEESYVPPQPRQTPDVQDPHIFSDSDRFGEYTIIMGNRSDRAKPNWTFPVILPAWIVREASKAEVVLSFILAPDGSVEDVYLDKSSGYPQLDNLLIASVRAWKFSNPTGSERVIGTFTYKVQ